MPTVTENPDSTSLTPTQSIGLADTWAGTFTGAGDLDDGFSIDLTTGLTYTIVLDGLGALDDYTAYFEDSGSSQLDGESMNAGLEGSDSGSDVIWDEVDGDALQLTFVADFTDTYTIGLLRNGYADGDISYTVNLFHGAIDNTSEGNDTIMGTNAAESWNLGDGDDSVFAGRGADAVIGGEGSDTIWGGKDNDTLSGDGGEDTVNGMGGNDSISGGAEADRLGGGAGADTIDGGAGDDRIFGNRANDIIDGGAGNDDIDGGSDDDIINGGEGDDSMTGSFGSDIYVFEANSGVDLVEQFQQGFDRIDVSALGYLSMGDLIITQAGTDTLIDLGSGNTVTVANTTASALVDADFIFDTLATTGTTGDDVMTGTSGADWFDGLAGDDILYGNGDDDLLEGNDGKDSIDGGSGADTIFGGLGNDSILGDGGGDFIFGDGGNDVVFGQNGNDYVEGGSGKDTIDGGNGDDTILGGNSGDVMTGGDGADIFVFEVNANSDFITDFEDGIDLMDVSALVTAGEITGFGDLTLTQFGGNLLINLYGSNNLTMINTDLVDITAADFIF